MFSKFDEDSQKVLLMAKKEMLDLKHPYVGSEHLLLAILHNGELLITQLLNEYQITYNKYRDEIIKVIGIGKSSNNWFLYTPLLKRIIENAILDCKDEDSMVTVDKLFISLLEEGDGVANRILLGMNIDIDLLYDKFSNKLITSSSKRRKNLYLDEAKESIWCNERKNVYLLDCGCGFSTGKLACLCIETGERYYAS